VLQVSRCYIWFYDKETELDPNKSRRIPKMRATITNPFGSPA